MNKGNSSSRRSGYNGTMKKIKAVLGWTAMANTLALLIKTKTRDLKARFIIFSLLREPKFHSSTTSCNLSQKLHSLLPDHRRHRRHRRHNFHSSMSKKEDEEDKADGGTDDEVGEPGKPINMNLVYNKSVMAPHYSYNSSPLNPAAAYNVDDYLHHNSKILMLENDIAAHYYNACSQEQVEEKSFQHDQLLLAEEEDTEGGGTSSSSVIEMVKRSKEEAGEEFSLDNDIDHVADLFIRRFRHHMMLQKHHSFKN